MTRTARRMFELLEPICLATYLGDEVNEEYAALGHRTYWDGYFAARAACLGRVPAEVVDAAFYSFAPGEVARHIPSAWETVPPEASVAAQRRGSVASLRRILGLVADSPEVARAADLVLQAATGAPVAGHVMYAGMRTLPVPAGSLERLWHAATVLREHRGDGHVAALVGARIGGTEAHALSALDMGIHPAESFGRIHHLPKARLTATMDGLRRRGLIDDGGRLTDAGRDLKQHVEDLTDAAAEAPYETLAPAELEELIALLTPISASLTAAWSA
ncbi:hypothetical protein GCM10023201_57760 [Actinomycetospora corticicola]|uniref:Uncharacterized protein n=1 Tax=Actinomycetospora corticicola TaxID=663602 RepID=A0A7Y9DRW2_9PSEU|nr:MarR family transcriptional regulator [Actinomycetospora corticicola]NYD34309.1 hypothetical protein [Actinomycetospora corticicola]